VCEGVQVTAHRAAEQHHERRLGQGRDLAHPRDARGVEPSGRHPADSPEPLDGKRVQELELTLRRHGEQPVRLRHGACHLREELRPRDADGDREAHTLANLSPEPACDLNRRAREASHAAHVEERLVDREPLDERRRVVEDSIDRLARLRVGRHPGTDHDRSRAEAQRAPGAHRRFHAARLRLVAGREHYSSPDKDRLATQLGPISLFHRREERIEVGMQDRRLLAHEHMFAHAVD
jgi:hypothetical protein